MNRIFFISAALFGILAQAPVLAWAEEGVCDASLQNTAAPELHFYEAFRVLNLRPTRDLEKFAAQTGVFLKRNSSGAVLRKADGSPVEARLRVLSDNPGDKIFAVGEFNGWGIGLSPEQMSHYELKPVPGTRYHEGVVPGLKHGQQYQLLLNGKNVLDPSAAAYTQNNKNSIFWDFERPGAYRMQNPSIDLRDKHVQLGEVELHGIVAKFPRPDGTGFGPANVSDTYAYIGDPNTHFVERFKEKFGYNAIHVLPINQSVEGLAWQNRYKVFGNFAPDSKFGNPDDFARAIDAFHSKKIAVIVDYLGSHFPYQEGISDVGLSQWFKEDGKPLFARNPTEWGTYRYDYENPHVRRFLIDGALDMLKRYRIDGLRIDNVGGILQQPGGRDFLLELTQEVRAYKPDAFIIHEDFFGNDRAQSLVSGGLGANARNGSDYFNFVRGNAQKSADQLDMNALRDTVRNSWGNSEEAQAPYVTNHDESAQHTDGATGAYFVSLVDGGGDFHSYGKASVFNSQAMTMGAYSEDTPQLRVLQRGSLNANPELEWSRLDDPVVKNHAKFQAALTDYVDAERAFSFTNLHANIENHTDYSGHVISLMRMDRATGKKVYILHNFTPNEFHNYAFGVDVDQPLKIRLDRDAAEFGGSNHLENSSPGGVVPVSSNGMHGKSHSVTLPYVAPYSTIVLESR